jgi:hypothetical protein
MQVVQSKGEAAVYKLQMIKYLGMTTPRMIVTRQPGSVFWAGTGPMELELGASVEGKALDCGAVSDVIGGSHFDGMIGT